MIINGERALAYTARCGVIEPIEGADNIDLMQVNGWRVIVKKGEFKEGDLCVYFEIDSKVPEKEWSEFLASKHYKVKSMKLGKFGVISQGLALPVDVFDVQIPAEENVDVTELLGVTYAVDEDNVRKARSNKGAKYNAMAARNKELFRKKPFRWLMRRQWGRELLFIFFGKKRDNPKAFPTHFPYIKKTDQERCENMTWILKDKTPFIVTQKCDGSSGTYILERKKNLFKNKFEFYVCSRNVRQLNPEQDCFYEENYYWQAAIKYNIKDKLMDYMLKHPELTYVCWQGEVCGPAIQKNPHGLSEIEFFCFHMIDSKIGKYDIRDAKKIWDEYNMVSVPIVSEDYIMPDDFEEFKLEADGYYDASVCDGQKKKSREGFVYYKTTDPNFSFKNVSRKYLLKHNL